MSERKCVNKYKKPDEQYRCKDSRRTKIKKIFSIRFMIPFDIICKKCSWVFKQGKKINALKENVLSENYLNISIFRFYFKCPQCTKGVSLKTDPKNSYYIPEINCERLTGFKKHLN
mmetsp:Transcript_59123/g.139267  ORF Transcript_59123/g.139267 Transcript_59123/m.139267 type:complete len:116 (-) Transcript_59123:902-1249(-)